MAQGARSWHVWCITGSGFAWGIYAKNFASEQGAVAGIQRMVAKGELLADTGGQVVTRGLGRPVGVAQKVGHVRRACITGEGVVELQP